MAIVQVSDYALSRLGRGASGSVHSVFSTSLNVMLDGFLLHMGSCEAPLSCLGATLPANQIAELLAVTERGDRALYRNGVLRIYSRAHVSEFALGSAPLRSMRVGGPIAEGLDGFDADLLRELRALSLPERTGLPWPDRSRGAVAALARFSAMCMRAQEQGRPRNAAAAESAARAMRGAVDYLMGRGLGLTPSGDDVLTGFGAALRFLYCGSVSNVGQPFFKVVSDTVPGKTTAVSEAYYQAMVDGYANEDCLALLEVIGRGDAEALPRALRRVLELGHTSGADSLLGVGAAFCCLY